MALVLMHMKIPKYLTKKLFLLILLVVVILIFNLIYYFAPKSFIKSSEKQTATQNIIEIKEPSAPGLPVRLKIPSMEIDVPLEYVGVTASGAMDIPKSTDKVGWFELGTRPGEIGTAVMAGHYGLYAGKPSVFDNLHNLVKGDKITIKDDKGSDIVFVVRETQSFDPQADATIVFSSDDEKSHLNLITCEGDWNKDDKSFSKRLVVFTDKE